MAKITHIYQSGVYASAIELILDNGEKITVANSSGGIKIYETFLFVFPKIIWRSDNVSFIEKCFPSVSGDFSGGPLEKIAQEIMSRFKNKKEMVSFLENFKV